MPKFSVTLIHEGHRKHFTIEDSPNGPSAVCDAVCEHLRDTMGLEGFGYTGTATPGYVEVVVQNGDETITKRGQWSLIPEEEEEFEGNFFGEEDTNYDLRRG